MNPRTVNLPKTCARARSQTGVIVPVWSDLAEQLPAQSLGNDWQVGKVPDATLPLLSGQTCTIQPSQSAAVLRAWPQRPQSLSHIAIIEERNRLAREIHDTLVQEFAGIILHLEAARNWNTGTPYKVSECLTRARNLAKSGLEDARRMLLGLRPKALEGEHLADALRQLAETFSRDCGIDCSFSSGGRAHELPEEIQDELYRLAQEALCNVRKHSRASSASVLLSYGQGAVLLTIRDDGQGFSPGKPRSGAHGFGLPTMCERAHRIGGIIEINSRPVTGTEIKVTLPVAGER